MKHNCYCKRYPKSVPVHGSYEYLSAEKVIIDGRVVSRSIYVVDDPSKRHENLNPDDFYLENLLANGVELKDCSMTPSDLVAIPHVLSRFASLESLKTVSYE